MACDARFVRARMSALLTDVRSGAFAARFMRDYNDGHREFERWRADARAHPIEAASARVRALMPWLTEAKHNA